MDDRDQAAERQPAPRRFDANTELRWEAESAGTHEFEVRTSNGSVIRFTLLQGARCSVFTMGDIETINIDSRPIDVVCGLRVVKDE